MTIEAQKDKEYKQKQENIRLASRRSTNTPISDLISPKDIDTITHNQEGNQTIEAILQSGDNQFCVEAFNKTNTVTSYRECINIHANKTKALWYSSRHK